MRGLGPVNLGPTAFQAMSVEHQSCSCSATAPRFSNSGNERPSAWDQPQAWNGPGSAPFEADGWMVSYQGAGRQTEALKAELALWSNGEHLAIADEAHHLGVEPEEPEGPVWGRTFLDLSQSARLRLGLTGTPFRADNLAFCAARRVQVEQDGERMEQIQPDLSVEPRELIAAGDVRPLEFRFQDGWVEHSQDGQPDREVSPLSSEQRESWRARNLRRAIRLADSSSIALQLLLRARSQLERVRQHHPRAAGLVIARDNDHARTISSLSRSKATGWIWFIPRTRELRID